MIVVQVVAHSAPCFGHFPSSCLRANVTSFGHKSPAACCRAVCLLHYTPHTIKAEPDFRCQAKCGFPMPKMPLAPKASTGLTTAVFISHVQGMLPLSIY